MLKEHATLTSECTRNLEMLDSYHLLLKINSLRSLFHFLYLRTTNWVSLLPPPGGFTFSELMQREITVLRCLKNALLTSECPQKCCNYRIQFYNVTYVQWSYEAAETYCSCSSQLLAVKWLHFIWNSRPHSLPETCFLLKRNSQSQTEKISTFLVPLWKNDYSHVTAKWASIFWAIARRYQCLKPTGTSRVSLGDRLLLVAPKL